MAPGMMPGTADAGRPARSGGAVGTPAAGAGPGGLATAAAAGAAASRAAVLNAPVTPARTGPDLLRLAEPVLAVLAVVLGTLSLQPFYDGWAWLPVLGGAAVVGGGVAALAAWRRMAWWLTTIVALLVFGAGALYACYAPRTTHGLPGLDAVRALGGGLVTGLPKMLTVGLPGDVTGDLLIVPTVLAFAAGLAVVLLALRTGAVTGIAVPPLVVYIVGLLLAAARPQRHLLVTGGLLLALLALLLLRGNRVSAADAEGIAARDAEAVGLDLAARRRHSTLGRIAFGLPVIVLVTALAVPSALWLPIADGATRYDPRVLHQQHFELSTALTPLVQVKPQLTGPRGALFTVKVDEQGGDYPLDRVRIAALDSFDGALWTQSRDFLITGATLPQEMPPPGGRTVRVGLDVDISRLPQPFLPVVGQPTQASGQDLAYDPANGTMVSTRQAVTDYHYRTVGVVRPLDDALKQAGASQTPADAAYTQLPDPPPWVAQIADQVTSGRQTAMSQLLAIEAYLRNQSYSTDSLPGHSYGALYRTLLGAQDERGGYAEQFASAFAVLARAKGYPTRVAVGYRLLPSEKQGDHYVVDSTDIHAWPEVHMTGYGWVPFEPTDNRSQATPRPPRSPDVTLGKTGDDKPQIREPERDQPAGDAGGTGGGGFGAVALRTGLIAAIVLASIALLIGLIVLLKWLRRKRRAQRGPPAARIVAAWLEVVDRLRERGIPVFAASTGAEVAHDLAAGRAAPAARPLAELAPLVAAAVFAFDEPDDAAATRAWQLEGQVRAQLAGVTPVAVRVRALIDPRPLLPAWLARRPGRRDRARAAASAAGAASGTVLSEQPPVAPTPVAAVAQAGPPTGRP
jgi:hypothetical protein